MRMQVQNQLNAFFVLTAALWCILALVTMILHQYSTQDAVINLWYVIIAADQEVCPSSTPGSACKTGCSAELCDKVCLLQGLGSQYDASVADGITPVWAADGHKAAQLC